MFLLLFKNIEECNPNKKQKTFTVMADMIADILRYDLYNRGRKLNISLVFVKQSHFAVLKNKGLNSTHYFVTKILNKRELQQVALNHSSDIVFQEFMGLYKKCSAKPYSLLVGDTTFQ